MKKYLLLVLTIFVTAAASAQSYTYPVLVSFSSECCGVPSNTPVMKLVQSFKKQYHIKNIAADEIGPMGKEGEYYLAFKLKELTKKQKTSFIAQLKKIVPTMTDKGSASVMENEPIDVASLGRATITHKKL